MDMLHKSLIAFSITLLVFLSFVPRVTEVLNRNYIFLLDQGRDYMAVKSIIVDHKLTLIGSEVGGGMAGIQGVFHGPFHFYFLAIPFILFRADPWGGVLLMFLFGLATIGVGFLFGRRVFNSTFGGIVVSLLIAISPPIIAQSRFVWNPHPSSFFILLALYFAYRLYEKKKKYFFLAAFFAGFVYNFESAIAVPLSLAVCVYSVYLLKTRYIKQYLSLIAGFVIAYLPFIMFEFRHGFQATKGVIHYLLFQPSGQKSFYIVNHFNSFFLNFFDTFPKQMIFPPIFFLSIYFIVFLYLVLKEKRKEQKKFFVFLFTLLGITFFLILHVHNYVFPYYLIHLNFIYIFIFTYIIISTYVKKLLGIKILFAFIFLIFLFTGTTNAINTFLKDYGDYGGMVKIKGKREAIKYIYRDAGGSRFGLLIFSPPIYTYPYDYLIWWYGNRRFHYIPHQEKRGVFYLLIEKDLSAPWTYEGWLKTVVKTGKVLYTKELDSGFIIQKRINETP